MSRTTFCAVLFLGMTGGATRGADPPPAVTIRLVHPDRQCERVLELFRGSRAPHPAAALAAWKRATSGSLGKSREAVIALFNPGMVRELGTFDEATLALGFDPGDGHLRWRATVPRDDGTVAALATALVLTGGASDPPVGAVAVDRLGPPGALLIGRAPGVTVAAGSREDLKRALGPGPQCSQPETCLASGLLFRIDPEGLGRLGPVSRRRVAEVLRALGCRDVRGAVWLHGEAFSVTSAAHIDVPIRAVLDPSWLDGVPASAAATVALALDPSPDAWDRAFAAADRVERADPARARLSPLRTRLNLAALAAGVRPEVDLWPRLRGLTLTALADREGAPSGALLALHAADPSAAERLATEVIPRLAAVWVKKEGPRTETLKLLGRVAGRPLRSTHRGATVLIGWGDSAVTEAVDAYDHPEKSAGAAVRDGWGASPPQRAGAFWPGRVSRLAPRGSPLALALAEAPPVLWWGRNAEGVARDEWRWAGLRGLVRRFLADLPLDPPPTPGGP